MNKFLVGDKFYRICLVRQMIKAETDISKRIQLEERMTTLKYDICAIMEQNPHLAEDEPFHAEFDNNVDRINEIFAELALQSRTASR
jgi:hypothetical protein